MTQLHGRLWKRYKGLLTVPQHRKTLKVYLSVIFLMVCSEAFISPPILASFPSKGYHSKNIPDINLYINLHLIVHFLKLNLKLCLRRF